MAQALANIVVQSLTLPPDLVEAHTVQIVEVDLVEVDKIVRVLNELDKDHRGGGE